MKKHIILIFLLISLASFSSVISDYSLFIKGEKHFKKEEYSQAISYFEDILTKYPDSNLIKSTYLYYFLGKSYFENNNFEGARNYLSKYTYSDFKYENIYLLGKSLEKLNIKSYKKQYSNLISDSYNYKRSEYEKLALEDLGNEDSKYRYILECKYLGDFSNIKSIDYKDVLDIANFYFSLSKYDNAVLFYNRALELKDNYIIKNKILKSLYYKKAYSRAIKTGFEFLENNPYKSVLYYYIGNSYRRLGKYETGISYLKKVKADNLQNSKNFIIGKLYYVLDNYKDALFYLESSNLLSAQEYIIKLYQKKGDLKKENETKIEFIKKYPYKDLSAYYRFELYEDSGNNNYLYNILDYNKNSYYYELSLKVLEKKENLPAYNFESKYKKYSELIEKINLLTQEGFYTGILLELDFSDFSKEDKIFRNHLLVKAFEKNAKFNKALKQSYLYTWSYSRHSNLQPFLYPKYYSDYVRKYSEKYNVPENLIYSIMKQESLFKKDGISGASAYGLMQLLPSTAQLFDKSITAEQLLEPEINIKIGTQYLKYLLNKFNGDLNKVIPAYNGGEGNVKKWIKRYGEITPEIIPFPQTRTYYKKVFNNYFKYNRIYR